MKTRFLLTALVLLLLGGGGSWWWAMREDPQLAKVRALGDEMFKPGQDVPREQRREQWETLRKEMEALTPEQREQLGDERRQEFERQTVERLTAFFKQPVEEQAKQLDEQIDQMQRWRERREQRRTEGDKPREGESSRGRGEGERRGPPGGGFGGAPWGGRGGGDANSRNERRREMIDRTSPEFRALTHEYRQMMGDRMKQRGIPAPSWGGPR